MVGMVDSASGCCESRDLESADKVTGRKVECMFNASNSMRFRTGEHAGKEDNHRPRTSFGSSLLLSFVHA